MRLHGEPSRAMQQELDVANGGVLVGSLVVLRDTHIPGPTAAQVPFLFLLISMASRTIGLGALAPLMSILRDVWIVIRAVMGFITDSNGTVDGRFWESIVSLPLHAYALCAHAWCTWWSSEVGNSEYYRQYKTPIRGAPPTPSPRS